MFSSCIEVRDSILISSIGDKMPALLLFGIGWLSFSALY